MSKNKKIITKLKIMNKTEKQTLNPQLQKTPVSGSAF